jgi:hypothetical protein
MEAIIEPPTPLERAETFKRSFQGWANNYAIQFGGPLYLVGSILTSIMPGDIDIRLQLDRETCVLWWGEHFDGPRWEAGRDWLWRKREELKQSRRITRAFRGHGPRIDFQFQCTLFRDGDGSPIMRDGKPFLRLDAVPDELFQAGKSDP